MRHRRSWPVLGAAILILGSLAGAHSYTQLAVVNPGALSVTQPGLSLITTPSISAICIVLPPPQAASPNAQLAAGTPQGSPDPCGPGSQGTQNSPQRPHGPFAVVRNNMAQAVLAQSAVSSNPDVGVNLTPTWIPPGATARIPLAVSAGAVTQPGSELAGLSFLFTWPHGQAQLHGQARVTFAQAAPPPTTGQQP